MSLALWEHPYIAGFFDGEGCIYAHHSACYIQMEIGQNDRRPLDFIQQRYGGKIRRRDNQWRWLCPAASSERFLRDMLPYLLVKKEQAVLALQFLELRLQHNSRHQHGRDANKPMMEARIVIAKAIKEAKKCH